MVRATVLCTCRHTHERMSANIYKQQNSCTHKILHDSGCATGSGTVLALKFHFGESGQQTVQLELRIVR